MTINLLPPGPGNPRNTEGDFVRLKDGRILFIYSRFSADGPADSGPASLAARYSRDEGRTWTDKDEPVVANEGGMNVMSVSLLRMASGEIALFYMRKNSMLDCRPFMRVSKNEGRTWSKAQTLYDGPDDDRDPSITQLKDGRLLCTFFVIGEGVHQIFSEDLGQTWSAPGTITATHYSSSPVRELSGGRLGLGLYDEKDDRASGAFTYSDDVGRNWSQPIDIDNAGQYLDAETDVIDLKGGSLYSVHRGGRGAQMHWTLSQDRGRTWGKSKPIGFIAHCPYLHRAAGDIILLAYRKPGPGPWSGTGLSYSLDECKSWSEPLQIDSTIGAYPSMVNLKDGSVLIVYYEEGVGSSIRARRLRVSPQGVEWLRLR